MAVAATADVGNPPMIDRLRTDERAQAMDLPTVAIVLVVAGVVGFIGILVMSEVISTANLSDGGPNSSADPLYGSQESLISAVDSAWGLYGVAFIVVILAVIVTYLYGIRGSGGGGRR